MGNCLQTSAASAAVGEKESSPRHSTKGAGGDGVVVVSRKDDNDRKTDEDASSAPTKQTISSSAASTSSSSPTPPATSSFRYTKDTCALEYWDPIRLLGEGSISAIHLVRRRPARVDIPYRERIDIMARAKKATEEEDENEDPVVPSTSSYYALKSIMKDHVGDDRVLREMRDEIHTVSNLCHPNVVRVLEAYERRRHVYLVMEVCTGGDLYRVEGTTEPHAKAVVRRILRAVSYMHQKGVVHRDLKLENIMFATPRHRASEVKIIDFGLATKYLSKDYKRMTDKVGTIYTMAPQVMQGVYDYKCDLWSLGVVTYVLLSASKPFWGPLVDMPWTKRKAIIIDRIMRADYVPMEHGNWDTVSDTAKRFVKSLLRLDPNRRPSAKQALVSPWMRTRNDVDVEIPSLMSSEQKRLRAKRLLVLLLTQNVPSAEIVKLERILQRYDPEETGTIALPDLRKALTETGKVEPSEMDALLADLDVNNEDYRIDHTAFITKALEKRESMETKRLYTALDQMDTENTGKINIQKLRNHLCENTSYCDIQSDWTRELSGLGEDDTEVEIAEVMSWFTKKTHHSLSELKKQHPPRPPTITEGQELATPLNASIPGGKRDKKSKPTFFYDEESTSMRRVGFDLPSQQ